MLIDEIKKANIEAMKAKDNDARAALSIVISRYQLLVSSGSETPKDTDLLRIIQKVSKELDEEREGYLKVGHQAEADAILKQKEVIVKFLPKMLSEEEIRSIVNSLPDKSIPSVMKHFKTNYDGQCDMSLVSKIAKGL